MRNADEGCFQFLHTYAYSLWHSGLFLVYASYGLWTGKTMVFKSAEHDTEKSCLLSTLPNEILMKILSLFPTPSLLPLSLTCMRIHDIIIRIFHRRLLFAASLPDHKLILECYHPASKYTEPYLFTEYLGTPGLSSIIEGEGLVYESGDHLSRLSKLGGLYSKFRPYRREDKPSGVQRHPAGGNISRWLTPSQLPPEERARLESQAEDDRPFVAHRVSLDPEDSFSQLCVVTNLVKLGPRNGVFENLVPISDGLVRIWREWLRARAQIYSKEMCDDSSTKGIAWEDRDSRTLWVSNETNIGITVRIKERKWQRQIPVLLHKDEEPAVSYSMEYEELRIRTALLLLAVEESLNQQNSVESGKAMVFGAFLDQASA